ncbi:MAG: Gfo/Idh/MocA family oxidoreductase [Acidimicrobiales bacterium]|nr:Gfo/Idh/MocA family oxidoreductase [Acidimicrobiales bacterium]
MSADRPSLALCGAGMISVVHGMAAPLASVRVVAVASRSAARAAERAGQLRSRAVTYDELPAGADAVVVATPPACHAGDTVRALEAGAAVLVEKPLATTLAGADAIVEAADRTGGAVVYAENLAFSPVVARAAALARGLGPLRHLGVRALQPAPEWGGFLDPSWGGGVLFDLGVHPLAVALLVAGDDALVAVSATLERGDRMVDEHAVVRLRFESSLVAVVECSWRHPTSEWDLQAAGDTGVVRAELMPDVVLERDGEPVTLDPTTPGADPRLEQLGYVDQLRALGRAAGGSPSWCDARFGRGVLDVVMAAYTSAGRGGAEVEVPFAGPRDLTPLQCWRAS